MAHSNGEGEACGTVALGFGATWGGLWATGMAMVLGGSGGGGGLTIEIWSSALEPNPLLDETRVARKSALNSVV